MSTQSIFATQAERLRCVIASLGGGTTAPGSQQDAAFNQLALETFSLQWQHNPAYRRWCDALGVQPGTVNHWSKVPAVPATAFKDFEMTCLPAGERFRVFHSSGTTEQRPGRHFHHAASLALYEDSLHAWFRHCVRTAVGQPRLVSLTPVSGDVPTSSLVHMFDTLGREAGFERATFCGQVASDRSWSLDADAVISALREVIAAEAPVLLVGTAFNHVHLLDDLAARGLTFNLPRGSRVLETGGYKGRSRVMSKSELHRAIRLAFSITADQIVCEYGMSELSSQAYDVGPWLRDCDASAPRAFRFPPWARAIIVSPEDGREVADGRTGRVRIHDLANLWSVAAVQTDDLAVRRGDGFELIGRATEAEARGCSLMSLRG